MSRTAGASERALRWGADELGGPGTLKKLWLSLKNDEKLRGIKREAEESLHSELGTPDRKMMRKRKRARVSLNLSDTLGRIGNIDIDDKDPLTSEEERVDGCEILRNSNNFFLDLDASNITVRTASMSEITYDPNSTEDMSDVLNLTESELSTSYSSQDLCSSQDLSAGILTNALGDFRQLTQSYADDAIGVEMRENSYRTASIGEITYESDGIGIDDMSGILNCTVSELSTSNKSQDLSDDGFGVDLCEECYGRDLNLVDERGKVLRGQLRVVEREILPRLRRCSEWSTVFDEDGEDTGLEVASFDEVIEGDELHRLERVDCVEVERVAYIQVDQGEEKLEEESIAPVQQVAGTVEEKLGESSIMPAQQVLG